jgi:hypothetical protein
VNAEGRLFTSGVAALATTLLERTCYIGRVQFGEDTGELLPAAKVIVTYP